jgi:hypothetical protein
MLSRILQAYCTAVPQLSRQQPSQIVSVTANPEVILVGVASFRRRVPSSG